MRGRVCVGFVVGGALLLAAAVPAVVQASSIFQGESYLAAPGEVNQITIDKHVNDFTYTDPGAAAIDPGSSSCTVAGNQVTCPWFSPALAFDVFAGDQNDTITDTQGGHPFEIDGGPGDDQITASEYLPASGGPGNDHMVGGPGSDWFYGGSRANNSSDLPDNDRMEGLGGGDPLYGQAGDDVIDGGEGNDHLEGGAGNDVEHGGPGNDFIDGLPGSCCSAGDGGSDVLDGGEGDDSLVGSRDNGAPDTFACGPGSDLAEVGVGDQVQSDCEKVEQFVGCPDGGGCTVALVVSAIGPAGKAASAAASKRHGRRVILGARAAGVGVGAKKELEVRLDRGRLKKVLRGDGKANALIEIKLLKKHKAKRIGRTPFGLSR
jgi:Ca2+-binding RTX toxin-like protein